MTQNKKIFFINIANKLLKIKIKNFIFEGEE